MKKRLDPAYKKTKVVPVKFTEEEYEQLITLQKKMRFSYPSRVAKVLIMGTLWRELNKETPHPIDENSAV